MFLGINEKYETLSIHSVPNKENRHLSESQFHQFIPKKMAQKRRRKKLSLAALILVK